MLSQQLPGERTTPPHQTLFFPNYSRLALARQSSVDWMPSPLALGDGVWWGLKGGSGSLSLAGSLLSSLGISILERDYVLLTVQDVGQVKGQSV